MKQLKTTTGESVWIYDDVFNVDETQRFRNFVQNSMYSIGGKTSSLLEEHKDAVFFHSPYSPEDTHNMGIFNTEGFRNIYNQRLKDKGVIKSWVLSSTQLSKTYFHVDSDRSKCGLTLVYYCNLKWDVDWGGETLFCNSNNEVELAVSFKPNRVVLFESHIPHKPAPTSVDAPSYRFTFVTQFG